jgi:hypothetical protein
MGLILAHIALDIAASAQTVGQARQAGKVVQDTSIEASLRAWAIRVLTEVRSSCMQDLHAHCLAA